MAAFAKSWQRRAARGGDGADISVDLSRVLINAQVGGSAFGGKSENIC
jgi:hypothetical protein